ncbi:hypothetical protein [Sulfuricurvum sp.]|uniref:hypothetical protein n=1 Tax=Sulfuricurvum sp. TaxID=2025608 RepID=UPI002D36CE52|nr:hypothetical protein [Sulfuricurvum sp.]HZF71239.1 hypothetical protein [Sulfuricurvum sp.]
MFLNKLSEIEKVAFLELAHHVARRDNDFLDIEKEMIRAYCTEMQINDIDYNENQFDIDDTLAKIQDTQSRRIVTLEIMAIIYADNILHEEEQKVIEIMLEKFGLNHHWSTVYSEWTKAILALYAQGNALIEL